MTIITRNIRRTDQSIILAAQAAPTTNHREIDLGSTASQQLSIDFSLGVVFFITLTRDISLDFLNVSKGIRYVIIFLQEGAGGYEVELPNLCDFNIGFPPSFNYPAAYVGKMQLDIERFGDKYHCKFTQFRIP